MDINYFYDGKQILKNKNSGFFDLAGHLKVIRMKISIPGNMKNIALCTLILVISGFTSTLRAQDDPINADLVKSTWEHAFKNGEDVFMGASLYNFRIQENKKNGKFLDYMPNAYSLFLGYSYVDPYSEHVYTAFEFLLGKREYKIKDQGSDTLNLFTANRYTDLFIEVPFRVGYLKPLGKNSFIGFESGMYFLWSLNSYIYNSTGKRKVNSGFTEDREMRMYDFGWANKVTWGFRAFYTQVGIDFGLRNFAPLESDYLLKNQMNISIGIGYRFGSETHKKDMKKINKVTGKFKGNNGGDDKPDNPSEPNRKTKRNTGGNDKTDDKNDDNKKDNKKPGRKTRGSVGKKQG